MLVVALPPKELYTIDEVASRWSIDVTTVEDYLSTAKLQASIRLPLSKFYNMDFMIEHGLDPEDSRSIIFFDAEDNIKFRCLHGLFCLNYPRVEWDLYNNIKLDMFSRLLSLPDEDEPLWVTESIIINKKNVGITLSEISRFEVEHDITFSDQAKIINMSEKSGKLHPKEKESLLKLVIVLAKEAYRYNPEDKKSPVSGEIAEAADGLGISIDPDTVRKWLKEAAELLPREERNDENRIRFTENRIRPIK